MAPWLEELGGNRVDPVDERRGSRIRGARGLLLVVGERHRAQRQDLVDLGSVEQLARALGRDLRVVVEDDRRRQHDVAAGTVGDEHRVGVLVGARLRGLAGPFRWVEQ